MCDLFMTLSMFHCINVCPIFPSGDIKDLKYLKEIYSHLTSPPLRPPGEQTPATKSGPSPSRSNPTPANTNSSSQNGATRQGQNAVGGAKPSTLPANLDEFKVKPWTLSHSV